MGYLEALTLWCLIVVTLGTMSCGKGCKSCLMAGLCSLLSVVVLVAYLMWQFGHHAGPPDWDRRCMKRLAELHVEPTLIDKLVNRKKLSRDEIECLLMTGDSATYCILASNVSLSDNDLNVLFWKGDDEVKYMLSTQLDRKYLAAQFRRFYDDRINRKRDICAVIVAVWFLAMLVIKLWLRYKTKSDANET